MVELEIKKKKKNIYIYIYKLHMHPVGREPLTSPSIPLLEEKKVPVELQLICMLKLEFFILISAC